MFSARFQDESCTSGPALGHTLSFRSHSHREMTFSYLDAVSPLLFISRSLTSTHFQYEIVLLCSRAVPGTKEKVGGGGVVVIRKVPGT